MPAFLNDYAFMAWGLIELYEATFKTDYLKTALDFNDLALERFWDETGGGFYFTADDGENVLIRRKEVHDGAVPSGNSVSMLNMLRLGRMTADPELESKAWRLLRAFAGSVSEAPSAHTQLLAAVDFAVGPAYEVVIAGDPRARDLEQMLQKLRRSFIPNKVVMCGRRVKRRKSPLSPGSPKTCTAKKEGRRPMFAETTNANCRPRTRVKCWRFWTLSPA